MTIGKHQSNPLENETVNSSGQNRLNIPALIGLSLIILIGAILRFYKLGEYSIGNTYYAAAVQSMLTSWKNFFFVAFEPGGSVTVDKPPLGLWVQAVSAYFLGLNGFSLALPQAVAGVLSIPLLYSLVKRHFDVFAGLVAAVVLAVVPVTVATERNNTMDGLLVFVLLLAAWAFIKATESGKLKYLILGAFLVGLGFNIKMLQAFMPLPAFYAIYFFGVRMSWRKRILHLTAATAVLLIISLSWAVIVDMIPPEDRPYIGSSTNNTVMELIIGHNGLSRLGLNDHGPGRDGLRSRDDDKNFPLPPDGKQGIAQLPGDGQTSPPLNRFPIPPGNNRPGSFNVIPPQSLNFDQQGKFPTPPISGQPGQFPPDGIKPKAIRPPDGGAVGGRNEEVGTAGLFRLFTEPLVTEASWLLPLALMGIPLAMVALGWSWPLSNKHISLMLWAGWLLPGLAYFSFTTGLFHRYYLIMVGPPMAALVGITAWSLVKVWGKNRWVSWSVLLVITGITITFEILTISNYPELAETVTATTLAAWTAGLSLLAWKSRGVLRNAAIILVVVSLLTAPFSWSVITTLNTNPNTALPTAGAEKDRRTALNTPNITTASLTNGILEYLLANTDPDNYLLATLNARGAAPYILATGRPVLTFGGFTGGDDVVSLDDLIEMIDNGDLRYILGLPKQKQDITRWMIQACTVVDIPGGTEPNFNDPAVGNFTPSPLKQEGVLYDCGS